MDSVMTGFAQYSGWAVEVREFGVEAVDRHVASDGLHAGDQYAGVLGRYGKRHDFGLWPVASAVHEEAEIREKFHTVDAVCDVGHHEPPREIPA
jgi:hypothetical protein